MAIMPALSTSQYPPKREKSASFSSANGGSVLPSGTVGPLQRQTSSASGNGSNSSNGEDQLLQVFISHVGDCRAVLGCNDGVAMQLTDDHKAGNKAEKIRIEAAKGRTPPCAYRLKSLI